VYPNEQVAKFIHENFIPVKIHIKEQPAMFHRFEANWTPTLMVFEPNQHEHYRFSGYLPPNDFLTQLELGMGYGAFTHGRWDEAERHFSTVAQKAKDEAGPEATYWTGVTKYKVSHNPADLQQTAKDLNQRFPGSTWAKRASVWMAEEKAA
jgi:hypothetical protein